MSNKNTQLKTRVEYDENFTVEKTSTANKSNFAVNDFKVALAK